LKPRIFSVLHIKRPFYEHKIALFSTFPLRNSCLSFIGKEIGRKGDKGGNKKKGRSNDDDDDDDREEFDVHELTSNFEKPIESLKKSFESLRVSRPTPALLEKISVQLQKGSIPLSSLGQVSVKEGQTLQITLHELKNAKYVEKAMRESELKLTPIVDNNIIKVTFPRVTQEFRDSLVKMATKYAEQAKIAIRNARKDAIDQLKHSKPTKDEEKKKEKEIQLLTDEYTKKN